MDITTSEALLTNTRGSRAVRQFFSDALRSWRAASGRASHLRPRTQRTHRRQLMALDRFFGSLPLEEITGETIRNYQRARSEGSPPFDHRRCAKHVNAEIGKLRLILTEAGHWQRIERDYKHLAIADPKRRQMTAGEMAHLFAVASSDPAFAFVHAYATLSVGAGIQGRELLDLRICDIDLVGRTVKVDARNWRVGAKARTVSLADDSIRALNFLLARAAQMGSTLPDHYLLPFKSWRCPSDPNRPMTDNGIISRWNEMRKAAGMPWATPRMLLSVQQLQSSTEVAVDWDKFDQATNTFLLHRVAR